MLTLPIALTALTTLVGQPQPWPPDMSDLLRAAEQKPNVHLVLDTSCSMSGGDIVTPCAFYKAATGRGGGAVATPSLSKAQMLEASLTGCRNSADGVLDVWDRRVNFGVRFFDNGTDFKHPFITVTTDAEHASLETVALQATTLGGATNMSLALAWAGRDFNALLTDGAPATVTHAGGSHLQLATRECRKNFVLFLSDGNPNGGADTGNSACNSVTRYASAGSPWNMADYLFGNDDVAGSPAPDHLCSVTGQQSIGTYTLGFGSPGSFDESNLRAIATQGGGEYFYAANVDGLNNAFEAIILAIVQRSTVFGGGGTVQRQGLFAGGINFLASYRTADSSWVGNLKKYCVLPPRGVPAVDSRGRPNYQWANYDTVSHLPSIGGGGANALDCQFYARRLTVGEPGYDAADTAKQILVPNPAPIDRYCTGPCAPDNRSLNADLGGAGDILARRLGAAVTDSSDRRDVFTYFPSTGSGLINIDRVSNQTISDVSDDNMWVPDGETWKIINRLNGYSYDANLVTGEPTAAGRWPFGDPVNTNPVLIRYNSDCDVAPGCVVAVPTNNGIVHFIQASDGAELAALVPGEFWRPTELNHFLMGDLENQPSVETARRLYLDGPGQLFHDDVDGDGVVEAADGDRAYLIFTMGRGGRVQYLMDVTAQTSIGAGALPEVHPMRGGLGSMFELRDTWANPWLGKAQFGGAKRRVAIFPSGHVPEMDRPERPSPGQIPGNLPATTQAFVSCAAVAGAIGLPASNCSMADTFVPFSLDMTIGPFYVPDAVAYRVRFTSLTATGIPNSYLSVQDGRQRWANVVNGVNGATVPATHPLSEPLTADGAEFVSNWVYSTDVSFRGAILAGTTAGYDIAGFDVITQPARVDTAHYPSIFVMDLDQWAASYPFQPWMANPPLLRLARNCASAPTNCVDATTGPGTAALEHMTCPISTEVSVVNYNSDLRMYWGDECGQIWVANNDTVNRDATAWKVRRLAHMSANIAGAPAAPGTNGSAPAMSDQNVAIGVSKNLRKFYRRLDIVASTCPGRRVFGVYFGTGDIQRPLALADSLAPANYLYLQTAAISEQRAGAAGTGTGGRDVIGVVFDYGNNRDLTLKDLYEATADASISRLEQSTSSGWYLELRQSEKMLRDPLVFQNIVYFKTFTPTSLASECVNASGIDTSYAMNNCSAEALMDFGGAAGLDPGDRVIGTANEDIGPDPYLLTTTDGPPIVVMNSAVNPDMQTGMGAHQRSASARPRIYNWRLPR